MCLDFCKFLWLETLKFIIMSSQGQKTSTFSVMVTTKENMPPVFNKVMKIYLCNNKILLSDSSKNIVWTTCNNFSESGI